MLRAYDDIIPPAYLFNTANIVGKTIVFDAPVIINRVDAHVISYHEVLCRHPHLLIGLNTLGAVFKKTHRPDLGNSRVASHGRIGGGIILNGRLKQCDPLVKFAGVIAFQSHKLRVIRFDLINSKVSGLMLKSLLS